jgi:isoamylase
VLKLVTDSLRYWVEEMHVDGFRFDLAPALARGQRRGRRRISAFFAVVHQDPVLSRIKLIAEPWDVGAGGYQVGNFPILWTEWNGRFRDTVRAFWRGDRTALADWLPPHRLERSLRRRRAPPAREHQLRDRARRLHAARSRELREKAQRGERRDNRDGTDDNGSQNCGVEGETDPRVVARARTSPRNLIATLLLSPRASPCSRRRRDGRTQRGNNNAYCQDKRCRATRTTSQPLHRSHGARPRGRLPVSAER